ncbi:MAG: hypothetical protein KJ970_13190 [Candidatus Eisenbacteria bacterium]|uniref:Uncharacterized protein n=1 Tax=Eiseniibacteriota bacterium TaxID=2212470 RepID=A0A948W6T7_UNCEI|nr:hypothetical protein [Candidatus Eisenbacteria bacterium]MBU1949960.1 hypothetical protein [Candidatus Eisenbacteria bacterium]MBU2691869.1 hypothetical protein [Candidatus Eisenbacteria bacterium]
MPHARQQIRAKFKSLLTGLTYTGNNVYVSKVYNSNKAKLPNLNIWTKDDETDHDKTTVNYRTEHELLVVVEVRARPVTGVAVDDRCDDIAAEVETKISTDPTLGGLVQRAVISSSNFDASGEAERPTGLLRMIFRLSYIIYAVDPTTIVATG